MGESVVWDDPFRLVNCILRLNVEGHKKNSLKIFNFVEGKGDGKSIGDVIVH